jgi:hypothetical protein
MTTDLSWLSPLTSVASVATPENASGNTADRVNTGVLPVLPPVATENGNVPQRWQQITLEELIEIAAQAWDYDANDCRDLNAVAAHDPDGLRLALTTDPLIDKRLCARFGRGARG